ncbi:MAG TPA: hypothetical protein VI583_00085 [Cyclobacteriaceae bacterium]|nr:hypothetical protein [Cyclobacteriaceae bacterium]
MKQEDKFDRIIGRILREDLMEKPGPGFTENVLERLGVQKARTNLVAKPILSFKSKIFIAAGYVVVMAYLFFFTGNESAPNSKYLDILPAINMTSLTSLLNFNSRFYTILVLLIAAGWGLILFDKFLKRFFLR